MDYVYGILILNVSISSHKLLTTHKLCLEFK